MDVRESLNDGKYELLPNASTLMRRRDDQILNEDDRGSVTHDTYDPHELLARKGDPDSEGARIPRARPLRAISVVRPADRLVQGKNLFEQTCPLAHGEFSYLNDALLHCASFARTHHARRRRTAVPEQQVMIMPSKVS